MKIADVGSFAGLAEYVGPGRQGGFFFSVCRCADECTGRHAVWEFGASRAPAEAQVKLGGGPMLYLPSRSAFAALILADREAVLKTEAGEELLRAPLPGLRHGEHYTSCRRLALISEDPLRIAALLFCCQPLGRFGVLHSHIHAVVELQAGQNRVLQRLEATNQERIAFDYLAAVGGITYSWGLYQPHIFAGDEPAATNPTETLGDNGRPVFLQPMGPIAWQGRRVLGFVRQHEKGPAAVHFTLAVLAEGRWAHAADLGEAREENGRIVLAGGLEPLGSVVDSTRRGLAFPYICFYLNEALFAGVYDAADRSMRAAMLTP